MTPSPSEIEQARAAVHVACLRWLRSEVEAVHPAAVPSPQRAPRDLGRIELFEGPAGPAVHRDRDHPLWDPWLDGGIAPR
jgi:hypothetical protein